MLENLVVVKRSGQRVSFNGLKIAVAIKQAFDSVNLKDNSSDINIIFEDTLKYIEDNYKDRKTINVEDIQDIIENKLKEHSYANIYNAFNEYRKKRAASRKVYEVKQEHKLVKAIEKIANDNSIRNNKLLTPIETLLEFGKTISREVNKNYILDNKFVKNHEEGNIYIHNLDYSYLGILGKTNLKLDLENKTSLDSLIYAKDEVNEEIQISRFDYLLEELLLDKFKSIYKNKITSYLNLTGFIDYIKLNKVYEIIDRQDSINFSLDLFESTILNEQIKNIFTNAYNDTYEDIDDYTKDFIYDFLIKLNNNLKSNKSYSVSLGTNDSLLGKIIIDNFIIIIEKLERLDNVSIIFKLSNDTTKDMINNIARLISLSKNIALSFKDTNYNKGLNEVEYFANGERIYENVNNDIKDSIGRIILSKTSINMARLGIISKNNNELFDNIDKMLELVKNELLLEFENIGDKYKENYNILFNNNIYDDEKLEPNQRIRKVIKNGALSISLIGLNECVFLREENNIDRFNLAIKILEHIRSIINKYEIDNKVNFILNENDNIKINKKLLDFDKSIYGSIDFVTNKEYYESIIDLFKDDFDKLAKIEELFNGGINMTYKVSKNKNYKKIIDTIDSSLKASIGYFRFEVGDGCSI